MNIAGWLKGHPARQVRGLPDQLACTSEITVPLPGG